MDLHKELDRLLPRVEKPAQYIGGERNSVYKEISPDLLRFAFCFPDTYGIGMSYVGLQLLYYLVNRREHLWCERVFAPQRDMCDAMREAGVPLFTVESKTPVREMDVFGFTLQYELGYSNVLLCLDLAGLPLRSKDRGEDDPIVIAGGPCAFNPEPLADFLDLIMVGDGEEQLPDVLELARQRKLQGWSKREYLIRAAQIPGVYVPAFYEPVYDDAGRFTGHSKLEPSAPDRVLRAFVDDLDRVDYPPVTLVPLVDVVYDRPSVEIFRGCTRGCRFCQAGMQYRPVRERSKDKVLSIARSQLADSGAQEISVLSLSTSDYSEFQPMVLDLIDYCKPRQIGISLPSLRMDNFAFSIMGELQGVRKSGLTFAAEAGTQRLRNVINKNITEEDIFTTIDRAIDLGWQAVKLYFMMGLPTETDEDLDGIVDLAARISRFAAEKNAGKRGRFNVAVSVSNFVPKPWTPFQWQPQNDEAEFERKHFYLKDRLRRLKGVTYRYHGSYASRLEAYFSRGDRRMGEVLETAYRKYGCCFDAWTESFRIDAWKQALADCGIGEDYFAVSGLSEDAPLPWEIIDAGLDKSFLQREWHKAQREETTPDCRYGCQGCGINSHIACPMEGSLR